MTFLVVTISLDQSSVLIDKLDHDFKNTLENFMEDYEESLVRTLQQLVDFHKDHADVCLPPGQP